MVFPDPEVVMGQERAPFRVADLVELARLVTRLCPQRRPEAPSICKDNFAVTVKQLTPQLL